MTASLHHCEEECYSSLSPPQSELILSFLVSFVPGTTFLVLTCMEVNAGVIDCNTPQHSRSWASWESGTGWHSYCDSLPAGARHYIPSAEEKAPGPQG